MTVGTPRHIRVQAPERATARATARARARARPQARTRAGVLVTTIVTMLVLSACSGSSPVTSGPLPGRTDQAVPVDQSVSATAQTTASGSSAGASAGASSDPSSNPSSDPSSDPASDASPSAPASLQAAFEDVRSGVVRIEVATCSASAVGTGFAITGNLLVTAAHVVEGGQVVRAIQGTSSRAATVVGIDRASDVALLRVDKLLAGHRFTISARPLKVGDQVAALGYPEGSPLAFSPGTVNGVSRKAVIDGIARYGLIEFDAATTHGNSGGPVIRADGEVVGLVDAGKDGVQGRKLAVSATLAERIYTPWRARTAAVRVTSCDTVLGPNGDPLPATQYPTANVEQAFATLDIYFRSVNSGDYPTALAQLLKPDPLEEFTAGVESTRDEKIKVRGVTQSAGQVTVWLTFSSRQEAGRGPKVRPQETCTDWSLDYTLRPSAGLWLIAGTTPHSGTGNAPCATP